VCGHEYFIVMSWKFSGETEDNNTKVSQYSCEQGKLLPCGHNIYVQWCINTVYQLQNSFNVITFKYKGWEEVAIAASVFTEEKHVKFQ